MKAYTNIQQSKKLAEILSLDSADQTWEIIAIAGANLGVPEEMQYWHNGNTPCILNSKIGIPCWSLAALLEILPDEIIDDNGDKIPIDIRKYDSKYLIAYRNDLKWSDTIATDEYENLVDTCVEMILDLHKQKLL